MLYKTNDSVFTLHEIRMYGLSSRRDMSLTNVSGCYAGAGRIEKWLKTCNTALHGLAGYSLQWLHLRLIN